MNRYHRKPHSPSSFGGATVVVVTAVEGADDARRIPISPDKRRATEMEERTLWAVGASNWMIGAVEPPGDGLLLLLLLLGVEPGKDDVGLVRDSAQVAMKVRFTPVPVASMPVPSLPPRKVALDAVRRSLYERRIHASSR